MLAACQCIKLCYSYAQDNAVKSGTCLWVCCGYASGSFKQGKFPPSLHHAIKVCQVCEFVQSIKGHVAALSRVIVMLLQSILVALYQALHALSHGKFVSVAAELQAWVCEHMLSVAAVEVASLSARGPGHHDAAATGCTAGVLRTAAAQVACALHSGWCTCHVRLQFPGRGPCTECKCHESFSLLPGCLQDLCSSTHAVWLQLTQAGITGTPCCM